MDTLLTVNVSHRSALERQMDVIANNMANIGTTAYKGERVVFSDYVMDMDAETPRGGDEVAFTLDYGTIRSTENGPIKSTDNPLDIALQGNGFFEVRSESGETLYTRRGHLTRDAEGFLALPTGERVVDAAGDPVDLTGLTIPPKINADGTISGPDGQIGAFNLVEFADDRALERRENSLFAATGQQAQPAQDLVLVQGALEGSNVDPIKETVKMIQVMRAYQSAQKSADSVNDVREKAIERLPRAN
jgi:flagellar basal-body rod protein FlgF